MHTAKHLWGAMAAMAALTACSTDSAESYFAGKGSEVVVNAAIAGEDLTRTTPDDNAVTLFSNGDLISVSDGSNSAIYRCENDGSKWVADQGSALTWDSEQEEFQAFYPADGTNTYDVGYLQQAQASKAKLAACDYMKGSQAYTSIPDDRAISLQMERQTALVVIGEKSISWGKEFNGTARIIQCKVMSSMQVPGDDNMEEIYAYQKTENCYYAIVSPTPNGKDGTFIKLSIEYTDDSGALDYKDLTINTIPKIEKGKRYSFALNIGKDNASIGQVSVEPWTDGTGMTGDIEFNYKLSGNTITVDEGVLAEDTSLIAQAIGSGNSLKVNGNINTDDLRAINNYIKDCGQEIDLDLEDAVIERIDYEVFSGNENLGKVKLPKTIISIGDDAFSDCQHANFTNLGDLTWLEYIGYAAFRRCASVGGPRFSENLKYVGSSAFEETNGEEPIFPKSVTSIGAGTFRNSSFNRITFEGNVDFSGASQAFTHLTCYLAIELPGCTSVPPCASDAFADNNNYKITLRVKSELRDQFAKAEGWKEILSQGGSIEATF